MANEPDNLVLELLREMRSDMRSLRDQAEIHSEQLKNIRKDMHEWQETTATAVGFAMHANVKLQTVDQRIEDLTKRVESLETNR